MPKTPLRNLRDQATAKHAAREAPQQSTQASAPASGTVKFEGPKTPARASGTVKFESPDKGGSQPEKWDSSYVGPGRPGTGGRVPSEQEARKPKFVETEAGAAPPKWGPDTQEEWDALSQEERNEYLMVGPPVRGTGSSHRFGQSDQVGTPERPYEDQSGSWYRGNIQIGARDVHYPESGRDDPIARQRDAEEWEAEDAREYEEFLKARREGKNPASAQIPDYASYGKLAKNE
jgi:hypothetical protein